MRRDLGKEANLRLPSSLTEPGPLKVRHNIVEKEEEHDDEDDVGSEHESWNAFYDFAGDKPDKSRRKDRGRRSNMQTPHAGGYEQPPQLQQQQLHQQQEQPFARQQPQQHQLMFPQQAARNVHRQETGRLGGGNEGRPAAVAAAGAVIAAIFEL